MQRRLNGLIGGSDPMPGATVRFAVPDDLAALTALDVAAWNTSLRFGSERIRVRLEKSPQGCLVLDAVDGVRAAIYVRTAADRAAVVRTPVFAALDGPAGDEADTVFQLLALVTDPATPAGFGATLLQHVVGRAAGLAGVDTILGITRFADFDAARDGEIEVYAARQTPDGGPQDPVPRFHASQGAIIEELVAGARPEDGANLGYGVLIRYPLRASNAPALPDAGETIPPAKIATIVEDSIRSLMADNGAGFAADRTVAELGLDSMALGDLRRVLSEALRRPISSALFFRCPSAAAMISALTQASTATTTGTALAGPPTPEPASQAPRSRSAKRGNWEPIAIIGHAVRLPAGGDTPEAFMDALLAGRDGVRSVPADRWDAAALTAEEPGTLGRMDSDQGGFLDRVDLFDPTFFGISRREAMRMDPQHRLLLEVGWEALERAGINPRALAGSDTGVIAGQFLRDYELLQARSPDAPMPSLASATGNAPSTAVGRISYLLDLRGPCYSVEGACAASLIAVHAACRALQNGDADLMLAGAVHLILAPEVSIAFSSAGMLSRDGRCRTLDAAAGGFGRGEGAGMFVLKRLVDAEADRDRIEGLIIGGALGQDGRSNGLVAPNGAAQEGLMRKALATAGLAPGDIDMIEMHGTGTKLGDAVEAGAIASVHAGERQGTLLLGSVKTNIGHLEAAAGAAGLAKVLGSFARGTVPANLHYDTPSPETDLAFIPARVPTSPVPWAEAAPGRRPVVGISGFGFNGSIAHLIVQAPEPARPATSEPEPAAPATLESEPAMPVVWPLSARGDAGLQELATAHGAALAVTPDAFQTMARTGATGRPEFVNRGAIVATSVAAMADGLRQLAAGGGDRAPQEAPAYALTQGPVLRRGAAGTGGLAFLFTGQGTHELGMARELYAGEPVARAAIDTVDAVVRRILGVSLVDALQGDDPDALDALAQPAILAIESALDAVWRSWGVRPARILGHSLGEFAAAVSAEVMTLEGAALIVAHRTRLIAKAPGEGAMAVIEGDAQTVEPMIFAGDGTVGIAALNGPRQTVVSGSMAGVMAVMAAAKAGGRRAHRVPVPHAFHSPMMEPILDAFEAEIAQVPLALPTIPYLSSVTAAWEAESVATPGYWRRHLRQTVRFREALLRLAETAPDLAVEVGPRPVLVRQIEEEGLEMPRVASLAGDGLDRASLCCALAAAFVAGASVDWSAVFGPRAAPPAILATSPYTRERVWFTDPPAMRRRPARRMEQPEPAPIDG